MDIKPSEKTSYKVTVDDKTKLVPLKLAQSALRTRPIRNLRNFKTPRSLETDQKPIRGSCFTQIQADHSNLPAPKVHTQLARDLVDRAVSSFHINTVCLGEREYKRATEAEVDSADSSALEPEMHTGLTQEMENLDIVDDFERKVERKCCSSVQIDGSL